MIGVLTSGGDGGGEGRPTSAGRWLVSAQAVAGCGCQLFPVGRLSKRLTAIYPVWSAMHTRQLVRAVECVERLYRCVRMCSVFGVRRTCRNVASTFGHNSHRSTRTYILHDVGQLGWLARNGTLVLRNARNPPDKDHKFDMRDWNCVARPVAPWSLCAKPIPQKWLRFGCGH